MKIEVSTVKGFKDYLPPESQLIEEIIKIVEANFKLFGFQKIETPIIEFDEIMRSSPNDEDEDEAVSDRFRLKDRGGRNLGLRYEFTFQLSRIFKENPNIKLPFKRFQIGPVFRDEPIRTGRTRQFTQCDVDIIGDASISSEAECIAALVSVFKEIKINYEIKINNKKLINSIIDSVEISEKKQVMKELDKLEKIGIDEVKANLKKYTSTNQIVTLFKLLEKDLEFFKDNAFDGAEEIDQLIKKCKSYGINTKFSPNLIRGLAYYTGNIFEAVIENTATSIAGGGRYDNSVGKYLPYKIPAVGFSFSIEAIIGLCPEQLKSLTLTPPIKSLIISFNREDEAINLSKTLRKNKISCSIMEGKPTKALDYANSLQIPYVIFLGEEEIKNDKLKLKEMKSGQEFLLSEKQLLAKLKR